MVNKALKRELAEWIVKLDDAETLDFIKIIKDSKTSERKWWRGDLYDELTEQQRRHVHEEIAIADDKDMKRLGIKVN